MTRRSRDLGFKLVVYSTLTYRMFQQAGGQVPSADARWTLEELQEQNQLSRGRSPPRRHKRRWPQFRSEGVLPKPAPEEEEPFILDLKNFPDLANADLGSQNPNIQVRYSFVCNIFVYVLRKVVFNRIRGNLRVFSVLFIKSEQNLIAGRSRIKV